MGDVIIACDFSNQEALFEFLKPFEGLNPYLKLGMEIIYKEGPQLVRKLKEMGCKIFLDLKLQAIITSLIYFAPPIISSKFSILYSFITLGKSSIIFLQP